MPCKAIVKYYYNIKVTENRLPPDEFPRTRTLKKADHSALSTHPALHTLPPTSWLLFSGDTTYYDFLCRFCLFR